MANDRKDAWDKAGVISQFLVPISIALVGLLVSETDRQHAEKLAEDQRQQASAAADRDRQQAAAAAERDRQQALTLAEREDRLADIRSQHDIFERMIGHLCSGKPQEQDLTLQAMPTLVPDAALVAVVGAMLKNTSDPTVAAHAVAALRAAVEKAASPDVAAQAADELQVATAGGSTRTDVRLAATTALQSLSTGPRRVYVEVESDVESGEARELFDRLRDSDVKFQGIVTSHVSIKTPGLRYFTPAAKADAEHIAAVLSSYGVKVAPAFRPGVSGSASNHLELWINQDVLDGARVPTLTAANP